MKLLQYLKQPLPLRHRLMLTIGLILLVFQLISTFWLWHESTEQIQLFEQALRENRNNDRHIMHEIREAIASLIVPGIFMVSLALLICYQAVRRITRPLADLQKELEARAADNLTPIEIHSSTIEIQAVVSALNDLVTRLTSTIENERLFTADVAHELRTPLSGVRLHLELLSKTHKVDVSPLIARLDQMMDSVSQLLQLARVGQSFSAGSYQHVKLLEDVILPPTMNSAPCWTNVNRRCSCHKARRTLSCLVMLRCCGCYYEIWWKTRIVTARKAPILRLA